MGDSCSGHFWEGGQVKLVEVLPVAVPAYTVLFALKVYVDSVHVVEVVDVSNLDWFGHDQG